MEEADLRILELIHADFPVSPNPYRVLAQKLGLEEDFVFARASRLFQEGTIRRIGPVIPAEELGLVGTLAAVACPHERVDEVARVVNAYPEVSHNYLRTDPQGRVPYNMWFTIAAPSEERLQEILREIKESTGLAVLCLPSRRNFKLRMNLYLEKEPGIE